MKRAVCLIVCLYLSAGLAQAASRTVCASGCEFTDAQAAIDAAVPGDVILLRAGETFVGNLVLRAKSSSATAFITIRSDAADAGLPADGVRLVPAGKPGANVTRAQLARLIGRTGAYRAAPVIRAELGAHHYRLQFLDIDGISSEGYYTLMDIGQNTATQTLANAPHHIVLDRVYAHGHPTGGMRRGIALNGRNLDVINSYFVDFFNRDEAQAITAYNGAGPFQILNNYLEAAGENIMFGGADPKTINLVPSDITIRGNHLTKKMAWRNAVLAMPAKPSVSAVTGGALTAATHYFKVVATLTSGGELVASAPSAEAAIAVGPAGAVRLSWGAVAGAAGYRVYRGTTAGGQRYWMASTGTSLTYTGSAEQAGTPAATGTRWAVKNLIELKNAQRVTIDGNLFENHWAAAQSGSAIVFTPRNQEGTAPWSVVRDVTFSNNVVRHVAAGLLILGRDYTNTSQPATSFRIVNNLFYDVSGVYGNSGRFMVMTDAPSNIEVDHNTIDNTGTIVTIDVGAVTGFKYTNNFSRHNTYGIFGSKRAIGNDSINAYLPASVIKGNVLAGGDGRVYPAGNYFPAASTFPASFVDLANAVYTLLASSPFVDAATDGTDIGADMTKVQAALTASLSGRAGAIADGSTGGGGSAGDGPGDDGSSGGVVTPPAALPDGWNGEDIGVVGRSGVSAESGGTFTVTGAGDVWGSADAFHYTYRALRGDGTIVARVAAIAGTESWTKAGVMIRGWLDDGSAQATMLVSKGKGLAFQRRTSTGALSVHTYGGAAGAPAWLKLTRSGNVITAFASANGTAWTLVGSDTFSMPADVLIGLAVTSHTTTATATGTFDNVAVITGAAAAALPAGWEAGDVGAVGLAGSARESAGTFTLKGAGADVWGSSDALQFVYRPLAGDGSIVARVATIAGGEAWTKAGVMMRQTLDAGSAQAFMLVSTGKGPAFQRRTVTGGPSTHTAGGAGAAPMWVRLTRSGPVVIAAVSADGVAWREVGRDTLSFSGQVYVGLGLSSHDVGALATATFDRVAVVP